MRLLARDESAVFLLYLPTVYLFLSRLFALDYLLNVFFQILLLR
jgi:hypothetical protein